MKHTTAIFCSLLLLASSAWSMPVGKVEVSGNYFLSESKIITIFGIRAGDEYREERVSDGLKRLLQTKQFSDLQARYRVENGTVILSLVVEEYPRVKEVRVQGTDKLKKEDVTAKVALKEGYFARPSLFTQDVDSIRALYAEKGYSRAKVEVRKTPVEKEHGVIVSYVVTEGRKIKIRHLDFLGNGALETSEIKKVMESRESRWWRGGDFKPAALDDDLGKIKVLYGTKGYIDADARIEKAEEIDGGKALDVYIRVDEGNPYTLGRLTWSGNKVVTDDEIRDYVFLKEGDPFALDRVEGVQIAINSRYWEQGYIWSRVDAERSVRGQRIDLNLSIVENNPASINEIKISGNTKTFETVIRRELSTYPGDRFILNKVQRSIRDVVSLGYFNGIPKLDTEPVNEGGDVNLLLSIEEKTTGNFRMGAGFSQLNSLSGFFGVQENNLFGRGKGVSLDWEFGKTRKNINLQYVEPYFLGTDNSLTFSVYNWIQDRVSQQYYTDRRKGFSVQLGRPFPWLDYTKLWGSYRFEHVALSNFSTDYPEAGELRNVDWPLLKSSVLFSLSRNSTDNPTHPTEGSNASLSAEFAGGVLQGNVKYMRYMADLSLYRRLFWKFTFRMNMEAGSIDGYNDPSEVQDFERFRLGGNRRNALRGYDFYEVVPEGNDIYVGGRFMTTFTHEVLFPFSDAVYGLAFFDAGNTWNSFGEADPFNLRRGIGLGIRIEMPALGNLGFDYGYGFDKDGGGDWQPHFTFGTMF
ncbi:MAG: outer membrane protein assembly factor BamA [Candidatus Krumholzibacteria bacterium]|nr:outer membrane protein assembly factor BamA [Candidatus Krumholzibacteria bacterium]